MTSGIRLKLREAGMKHIPVTAAGNCFYLGASIAVHGKSSRYQEVRKAGAAYLENNANEFVGKVVDGEIQATADSMRVSGNWADDVSIMAVEKAYGRPIEVWQRTPDGLGIESQFNRPIGENSILLWYNGIGKEGSLRCASDI